MNHQTELQEAQQILEKSPMLFWFVCLRNMTASCEKDRVEKLLCTRAGQLRQVGESQLRQKLLAELPRNPAFAASVCRQYQLLQRTEVSQKT